jgi:hypothetical protein
MAEHSAAASAVIPGAMRFLSAWLIGTAAAYTVGSVAQSLFVISELVSVGAEFDFAMRMHVIFYDFTHLGFGGKYIWYGLNLAVGFLIAFPCAMVVARVLKLPIDLIAAVAGAVAIFTMITIVHDNSPSTIFYGTRGWDGMSAQIIAGALGGAIFAVSFRRLFAAGGRP